MRGSYEFMAYVVDSGYCFAEQHYLRDRIPQQSYQLFFGVFMNYSNRKLLAVHALGSLPAYIPLLAAPGPEEQACLG